MFKIDTTQKFLLECERANSDNDLENAVRHFSNLTSKIQWQEEIEHKFGVTLSVYLRLKEKCKNFAIPDYISELIETKYANNILFNTAILDEAAKLSSKFSAAGIDSIFLKGTALFATVYEHDIGLRAVGDIDILIKKDQLFQAEKILREAGYKDLYTEENRDKHLKGFCHLQYRKDEIMVELHWDITHDVLVGKNIFLLKPLGGEIIAGLFRAAKKVKVNSGELTILSPADKIFAICCHFNKHWIFERYIESRYLGNKLIKTRHIDFFFGTSHDLKKLVARFAGDIDWDRFFLLAKTANIEFETFAMLYLAAKVFDFSLPEEVIKRMNENGHARTYISLSRGVEHDNLSMLLLIRDCIFDSEHIALSLRRSGFSLKNEAYRIRSVFSVLLDVIVILWYGALRPWLKIKRRASI